MIIQNYKEYHQLKLQGSIGGLLGTKGGASGTGYKAPAQASIVGPTTADQLLAAQAASNNTLSRQQDLLSALSGGYNPAIPNQQGVTNQQNALLTALESNNAAQNQGQVFQETQGLAGNQLANEQSNLQAQQGALNQQQNLNGQLANAGGIQGLKSALMAQQALAGNQQALASAQGLTAQQYQDIANGVGANPAQAMLNQATGQNVANQAALMAGQRGAASNIGLIARQAAQQGANLQQQAVGQGATMQAQQSLGALAGLAAQQQAIGGTNQAIGQTQQNVANIGQNLTGLQQQGISQQQQQALGLVGQQQAQQSLEAQQAQAQLAAQQSQQGLVGQQANILVGQQIANTQFQTQAQQAQQAQIANQIAQQNAAKVGSQQSVNAGNTGLAQTTIQGQQGLLGGAANAIGGALSALAHGGEVKKRKYFDQGGYSSGTYESLPNTTTSSSVPIQPTQTTQIQGPQSSFGKFLKNMKNQQQNQNNQNFNMVSQQENPGAFALQQGFSNLGQGINNNLTDKINTQENRNNVSNFLQQTPQSPSNAYTGPDTTNTTELAVAKGGIINKEHDYRSGGKVIAKSPKEKATKSGDNYSNDKIPAVLSEHEIVIPRSVTLSRDPIKNSAIFVAKTLARRRGKK